MSQGDEQAESDKNQAPASGPTTPSEEQERLQTAYGGVERETEFHVIVEQDGRLCVVHSGGAVHTPPAVETVYAIFADGIEGRNYVVGLEADIEHSSNEAETSTQRAHQLRQKGSSEWGEPWAVEATLQERTNGWLVPTELKFEGLAKHASLGLAMKSGIEGGPDVLGDIV